MLKHLFRNKRKVILNRHIAIGIKIGIAGVVVSAVKCPELIMCQTGYGRRVPPGIVMVGRVRIQRVHQRPDHHLIGRRHGAFHLIIDHTLDDKFSLFGDIGICFDLHTMPLLFEAQRFYLREKSGIQINRHEVVIIFSVLRGKRIHGPI